MLSRTPEKAADIVLKWNIAGTPAQNAPGEWTVRLNRNGTEVAEKKFTISK